jgi:hypothetical protein
MAFHKGKQPGFRVAQFMVISQLRKRAALSVIEQIKLRKYLRHPFRKRYNVSTKRMRAMQQILLKEKEMLPGLPALTEVEDRLLHVLSSRTSALKMNAIYRILAEQFGLTRSERYGNPFHPKGSGWEYLVRHAKRDLCDQGWLHSPDVGLLALTPAGREEARKRQPVGQPANEP